MSKFSYKVITASGEKVQGDIEAIDQNDAAALLNKSGYTIITIAEARHLALARISGAVSDRIRPDDLLIFYSQMYDMIGAGITFMVSLESISGQTRNKKLKNAIQEIDESIKKGVSISGSFERHTDIFPELFINMIKSGEASGRLDVVLGSYIALYESQLELKQKVGGALFYPFILLGMGMAIVLFLVIFIIPKFVVIFTNAGVSLPWLTRMLYGAGTALIRWWYLILIGGAGAYFGIRRYLKTGLGRARFDACMLSLPVIGELNRNLALTRFLTTLGLLLKSGVPIIKALRLAGPVMRNVIMEASISALPERMEKGETLSSLLKLDRRIPPNIVQMIATGEETGNLVGMLEKTGAFYDKAIQRTIKRLTVVIEPLFLVMIGSVIGVIMASILIPLFKMIDIARM